MRGLSRMALFAVLFPLEVAAAQGAELQLGTKLKVRAPATVAGRITGTLIARSQDSITVTRANASPIPIALRDITELQVSRGKDHGLGARNGAIWGGGIGAAMALLAGTDASDCEGRNAGADCGDDAWALGVAYTAAGGAIIGVVTGAIIGAERWDRLAVPVALRLTPGPEGRGVRVVVGWSWQTGRTSGPGGM
jgi:hypothetical protein